MIAPERAAADRKRLFDAKDVRRERFSLTTATVRALVEKNAAGDDQMVLEARASSTCIDLMGDRLTLGCLPRRTIPPLTRLELRDHLAKKRRSRFRLIAGGVPQNPEDLDATS
jgi:hypothetical protein